MRKNESRPRFWVPARRGVCLCFFVWHWVVVSDSASAQDSPELITDRPDQTESSVVVPKGAYQLEVGWTFSRDDKDGVRSEVHEAPGSLLRIGLSKKVELRVGWSGFVTSEVRSGRSEVDGNGIGDGSLGTKIYLAEERGTRPEVAVLVEASVPIGDKALTSDRFDPSVRLAFAHSLSDKIGLGYNLGMRLESRSESGGSIHTLSSGFYTLALGFDLVGQWGAFVEFYGDIPMSAPGDPAHSLDGGLTYVLRNNIQLDLATGLGLSGTADDWFFGLGLSIRLPN